MKGGVNGANVSEGERLATSGVEFGSVFLLLGTTFNFFLQQTEQSRGLAGPPQPLGSVARYHDILQETLQLELYHMKSGNYWMNFTD